MTTTTSTPTTSTANLLFLFFYTSIFSGFAIDQLKKYRKAIKNDIKVDAVDPRQLQTTAPHPPVTMDRCLGPYNSQNPVK